MSLTDSKIATVAFPIFNHGMCIKTFASGTRFKATALEISNKNYLARTY